MAVVHVGKAYVLTAGRRAGETIFVTKIIDANFAMVKDEKGKERRSNIRFLEPLPAKSTRK